MASSESTSSPKPDAQIPTTPNSHPLTVGLLTVITAIVVAQKIKIYGIPIMEDWLKEKCEEFPILNDLTSKDPQFLVLAVAILKIAQGYAVQAVHEVFDPLFYFGIDRFDKLRNSYSTEMLMIFKLKLILKIKRKRCVVPR